MFYDMSATRANIRRLRAINIDRVDNVWDLTIKSPVGDQFSTLVLKSNGSRWDVLNKEHGNLAGAFSKR